VAPRPDPSAPADEPRPEARPEARPPSGWVRLGRLGRPFQLRGALHLRSAGPAADAAVLDLAAAGATVWLSGVGATRLREARRVGGGVVVALQGAYTPERARAHVHRELWADVAAAAGATAPGEDDVAVELLEGAAVRVDGEPYGRVAQVVLGAQDLLIVEGPDGRRWVPWAAPYVSWDGSAVDIDDPPPGLLDDDA
jgi:ribosomal 30S subunit maturation factor RimM